MNCPDWRGDGAHCACTQRRTRERRAWTHCVRGAAVCVAASLSGCDRGAFSAAGQSAQRILDLYWLMAIAAALIWLAVMALAIYARYPGRRRPQRQTAWWMIALGGALLPAVLLTTLLVHSLPLIPALQSPGDGLRIRVDGERWWWRVHYRYGDIDIELANEIRLPMQQRVELELTSDEVIHSLWIPQLAGKIDMIPGHTTRLLVQATQAGTYAGICAEYCGSGHARMRFETIAMPPDAFDAWLAQQAQPRAPPTQQRERDGARAFLAHGCGGCHRIRGSAADGRIGPDLTHLATRASIGAGTLELNPRNLQNWIARPHAHKPGVLMPGYDMLTDEQHEQLAAYLLAPG